MFALCTSLITAPKILPATSLNGATYCYDSMFSGCSSLITAPELPATTLALYCYSNMFQNCISLTTAPELPANTLALYSYNGMFDGCSSLTYIKHYVTSWYAVRASNWLRGVAASGTVECPSSSTIPANSVNGIPTGWTRVDF